jgi:hypothetical protein
VTPLNKTALRQTFIGKRQLLKKKSLKIFFSETTQPMEPDLPVIVLG